MPYHRARPMLVARGVQPTGPDRRAPVRPIAGVTEAIVPGEIEAKVDADAAGDDREKTDDSG